MKRRFCAILLLAALALPMSGCPIPAINLGIWLLTIDTKVVAIWIVEGGGSFVPNPLPDEADTSFNGTVTWEQNGRTIAFTQVTSCCTAVYTGTLRTADKIVNGTWMQTVGGSASGTWTGMTLAK